MGDAWLWWFFIQMLGLVCLPLTLSVFANLPDRGWALAKSLGVLSFCFLVWFPLTLPSVLPGGLALPYSRGSIVVLLLLLGAFNGWLLRYRWYDIVRFVRRQVGYVVLCEALFAGAYALLIWLRSFTPEVSGTEKPMDEAFISAIMRSPHLPPNDPWLSGYSLNYYYLGHFIVATIAKLLGTSSAVAFNTAVALIFALMAANLFGVTVNVAALLRLHRRRRAGGRVRLDLLAAAPYGLAAVLLSLFFGNLAGASQWLAQLGVPLSFERGLGNVLMLTISAVCLYGLGWSLAPLARRWWGTGMGGFSQRRMVLAAGFGLALVALLPALIATCRSVGGWLSAAWPKISHWLGHPQLWTTYNWWTPSRALRSSPTDYQNITEFPAFSFVLADLHAHVLALPFTVLALGIALNLLLAHGRGLDAFGSGNGWRTLSLVSGAIIIGGLYMLNGWDLPTYAGLVLLCLAVQQWRAYGRQWSKALVQDFFTMVALWLVLGVLLYLPFIRSFRSPSQGIGLIPPLVQTSDGQLVPRPIVPSDRSSLADFWSIFGVFLAILGAFLLWQAVLVFLTRWRRASAERAQEQDDTAEAERVALGPVDAIMPFILLTLLMLALALILLTVLPYSAVFTLCLLGVLACAALAYRRLEQPGIAFALILAGTALALIGVCEVVYLRDVFDHGELFRMNTVFKLYYQAWTLLSVAGGVLLYELLGSGWSVAGEQSLLGGRLKKRRIPLSLSDTHVAVGSAVSGSLQEGQRAGAVTEAVEQAEVSAQSGATGDRVASQAGEEEKDPRAEPADLAHERGDGYSYSHPVAEARDEPPGDEHGQDLVSATLPARRGRRDASDLLLPGLRTLGMSGKLVWLACFLVLVLGALVYPVFAPYARTGRYEQQVGLDGAQYLSRLYPGDAAAIRWINSHIKGDPVIVEATGGEYSDFARVSTFTGLPTVLGWAGHEVQWRVNWLNDPAHAADFNRRAGDLDTIYTSPDRGLVMQLLQHYHARYLYVGALEQQKYQGKADLGRFAQFLRVVYRAEGVTIYEIP